MARLGYDYVVVDAGVQLAYDWNIAREIMACECNPTTCGAGVAAVDYIDLCSPVMTPLHV
jgi:hypothetical protein